MHRVTQNHYFEPPPVDISELNRTKLNEFKQLEYVRKLNKPNLSIQQLHKIQQQLTLEGQAKTGLSKRKRQNDLMFRYDYNPMTEEFRNKKLEQAEKPLEDFYKKKHTTSQEREKEKRLNRQARNKTNLVDQLQVFRQGHRGFRSDDETDPSFQLRHIQRHYGNISKFNRQSINQTPVMSEPVVAPMTQMQINQSIVDLIEENDMDFDEIVSRQQRKFQIDRPFDNIFEVLSKPESSFKTARNMINKLNFCQDSMKETLRKVKIFFYRDISAMSRRLVREEAVKEQKSDYVSIRESNSSLTNIGFDTVLAIASGRFKPQDAQEVVDQNNYEHTSGDESLDQISISDRSNVQYSLNTNNIKIVTDSEQETKQQAHEFEKQALTKDQQHFTRKLAIIQGRLKKVLQMEEDLIILTIEDRMLIDGLKKQALDEMEAMLSMHKEFAIGNTEEIIRKNKHNTKNRCQELHVKHFTQLFKMKKAYELRSRSKRQMTH